MIMNKEPLTISRIKDEGKDIKTFFFEKSLHANPGRYVMAWLPDYGEKPLSVSDEDPLAVTVKRIERDPQNEKKGKFTNRLFELEEGDTVWMSGPKGRGFPMAKMYYSSRLCLIGGGTGIAPLSFLSKKTPETQKISFLGAKTVDEMIMEREFEGRVIASTDDGSYGFHGTVIDSLKEYGPKYLRKQKAAICGPEKMMKKAAEILVDYMPAEDIYISVERLMKCGVGLCGSCDFGGYRACVDGPVFTYATIKDVPDFGKFKRNRSGGKELL